MPNFKHIKTLKGLTFAERKAFSKHDTIHYFRVKKYDASHLCGICGKPIVSIEKVTLDHIIPRSKGGRTREWNTRIAHAKCNSSRGNKDEYYPPWLRRIAYEPMTKNTPQPLLSVKL